MISVEKPGTPEELIHFGVKGMKWGVRRTKGTKKFNRKFATQKARDAEIRRARESEYKSRKAYERASAKGSPQTAKLRAAYLKNPDRATALRMTSGEKMVRAVLYVFTPTVVVPAAIGVEAAYRVGKRRGLES